MASNLTYAKELVATGRPPTESGHPSVIRIGPNKGTILQCWRIGGNAAIILTLRHLAPDGSERVAMLSAHRWHAVIVTTRGWDFPAR